MPGLTPTEPLAPALPAGAEAARLPRARLVPSAAAIGAALTICVLLHASSAAAQQPPPAAPPPPGFAPPTAPTAPPPAAPPTTSPQGQPTGTALPPPPPPPGASTYPPPPQGAAGTPPQGYGPYGPYSYPYGYYPPPGYYPEQLPPPPPPTKRANGTLMTVGIVLTSVGAVGVLSGLAAFASANNRIDIYCDGGNRCGTRDDADLQITGAVMMIVGGVMGLGGIPLWVIGGRRVPLSPEETKALEGAPPATTPPPSPAASLRVGPTSASLVVTF